MQFINEIESKDISLSSFKIKKELNPKFWPNGKLNSRVRLRLMDIADDFIQELSVDWVKPKDVIFTGSIANYNWSRYSDVDLHILIDFKKVYPKNQDFVDDYFKAKKENWLSNHEDLKIFGFPIEISVEDSNEDNPSSGRYSLYKNKWLVEPDDFQDAVINQEYVKKKAAAFMTQIDKIEKEFENEKDSHKCEKYGNKVYRIFDKLKTMRSEGLESDKKEMSSGNIIYKIIRRAGYIDKIWEIFNASYDRVNSINERKEINEAQSKGEKFSAGIIPFRMNKNKKTEVFLGFPGQPKAKNFEAPFWMNHWQILKGHMENGEDPLKCAVREFSEESGIPSKYLDKKQLINLGTIPMNDGRKLICYGIDLTDNSKFDSIHFHSNMIDSQRYIKLNHGKPYPEIEKYNWMEVDNVGSAKSYEKEFYRRCDRICQERYKTPNKNKTVIISNKQKNDIKESIENELRAYHGAGRDFDKFDHSFMGSGEGHQAHGWGTYVTIDNNVANVYSGVAGSGLQISNVESDIYNLKQAIPFRNGKNREECIRKVAELEKELEHLKQTSGKFVYEVEIPDNNGSNYIEEEERVPNFVWHKFVNKFRGENKEWALGVMKNHINEEDYLWRDCVKSFGTFLGSPKKASQFFYKLGYVGIHYNGRSDGECYVIFNENDIKIVNKERI